MNAKRILIALLGVSLASLSIGQGGDHPSSDLENLTKRVDEFYCHMKAKRYELAYGMWVDKHRADPEEMKEHMRYAKKMARGIKIEGWTISAIETSARLARVTVELRSRVRDGSAGWVEDTSPERDFWRFENGDWYLEPLRNVSWADGAVAHEVPESAVSNSCGQPGA